MMMSLVTLQLPRLIELGRQKSIVTMMIFCIFFSDAEQDLGQLEEALATLMSAGIPYIEDEESIPEPTERIAKRRRSGIRRKKKMKLTWISTICVISIPMITIGLYLKEVSRVPY